MPTIPTSNPVPSESPRDLKFNAGKIDEIVNSTDDAYSDRFGRGRLTWRGIENISLESISKFGYVTVDSFEDGATITTPNQVLRLESTGEYYRWDGDLPKVVPPSSTPESSGGQGAGKWLSVGAAVLSSPQDGAGDSLIAVKQPFAGSATRTQHEKNLDVVTVEDFGAVGNGVADDTAAIQAALSSGASLVTSRTSAKRNYKITTTLLMQTDNQTLSLNNSELDLDDSAGTRPHIAIGKSVQMNGPKIEKVVFTNKYPSTVYQVTISNVGAWVVQDCLSYADNKAYGFLDITRCIVGYFRRNTVDSVVNTCIRAKGTGNGADVAIDVAIYDNRFVKGKHALRWGDYCEGLFFRRNICYAQTDYQLVIEPSSAAVSKLSGKIQDNDFDSPSNVKGGIYIQFYKNLQITGNWFANNSTDAMITLESTDSVIIQGNQCYPFSTWLSDNGVNTSVTGNLVIGGITHVLYGASADMSSVTANHMTGASSFCINANSHAAKLTVSGNFLSASSGGIGAPANVIGHRFYSNTGDTITGTGNEITIGASPAMYTTGPRNEILGFKGGSISSIAVNGLQMATGSNVTIGPLPPHSSVVITYTGAIPGVSVLRV